MTVLAKTDPADQAAYENVCSSVVITSIHMYECHYNALAWILI
jgi:hypothetical protein